MGSCIGHVVEGEYCTLTYPQFKELYINSEFVSGLREQYNISHRQYRDWVRRIREEDPDSVHNYFFWEKDVKYNRYGWLTGCNGVQYQHRKQSNPNFPYKCFCLRWKHYHVPIGNFVEPVSPRVINDLILEEV